MRRYDAILFDLGSTLIYFNASWPEVTQRASQALFDQLARDGLQLDREPFIDTFRNRLNDYYVERDTEFIEYTTTYILKDVLEAWGYPAPSDGILRRALDAMYTVSQKHWQPEDDAHATLQTLHALGYQLGIISNAGDDKDVQTLVDQAQLRPYFGLVLSSAALGIRKPNPRIFMFALERLGVAPVRAAMIGDTLGADILGAQNAGIFDIWITRRADTPANRGHAETILPSAIINTLAELPAILDG
jgi:putative hydrolase of the HAD superfamily